MASIKHPTPTVLTQLLRACTDSQRQQLAELAGTSVGYLYGLAGCHRKRVSLDLALRIEDASVQLSKQNNGLTPTVTARQLAVMCELCEFTTA